MGEGWSPPGGGLPTGVIGQLFYNRGYIPPSNLTPQAQEDLQRQTQLNRDPRLPTGFTPVAGHVIQQTDTQGTAYVPYGNNQMPQQQMNYTPLGFVGERSNMVAPMSTESSNLDTRTSKVINVIEPVPNQSKLDYTFVKVTPSEKQGIDFGAIAAQTPEGARNYPTANLSTSLNLSKFSLGSYPILSSDSNQFAVNIAPEFKAVTLTGFWFEEPGLAQATQSNKNPIVQLGVNTFNLYNSAVETFYFKAGTTVLTAVSKPGEVASSFVNPESYVNTAKDVLGTASLVAPSLVTGNYAAAGSALGSLTETASEFYIGGKVGSKVSEAVIPKIGLDEVKIGGTPVFYGVYAEKGTRAIPLVDLVDLNIGRFKLSEEVIAQVRTKQSIPIQGASVIETVFINQAARQLSEGKGSVINYVKDVTIPGRNFEGIRQSYGVGTFRQTQYTQFEPSKNVFTTEVKALVPYPETQARILQLINKEKDIVMIGSSVQKELLGAKMERIPGDYDTYARNPTEFANKAEQIFKETNVPYYRKGNTISIQRTPENIKFYGKAEVGSLEIHVIDVHDLADLDIDKPSASGSFSLFEQGSSGSVRGFGAGFQQPPRIKIGNLEVNSLADQGIRKGLSSLGLRPQERLVNPAPHRLKDIGDFELVQEALIERGKTSLNPITRIRSIIAEEQFSVYKSTRPDLNPVKNTREVLFTKFESKLPVDLKTGFKEVYPSVATYPESSYPQSLSPKYPSFTPAEKYNYPRITPSNNYNYPSFKPSSDYSYPYTQPTQKVTYPVGKPSLTYPQVGKSSYQTLSGTPSYPQAGKVSYPSGKTLSYSNPYAPNTPSLTPQSPGYPKGTPNQPPITPPIKPEGVQIPLLQVKPFKEERRSRSAVKGKPFKTSNMFRFGLLSATKLENKFGFTSKIKNPKQAQLKAFAKKSRTGEVNLPGVRVKGFRIF